MVLHVFRISQVRLTRDDLISCWLNPRESGPEVVQEPGGVTTSLTFAWSRLGVEPPELFEITVDLEVLQVLLGLPLPRPS